jgi:hypothetical protein
VRQSIFPAEERDRLYDLFEKYRAWLSDAKLYDLNLLAQDWLALAAPCWPIWDIRLPEAPSPTSSENTASSRPLRETGTLDGQRFSKPTGNA